MDASNPILSGDRRSIAQILDAAQLRKRQDLAYLAEVARTSARVILPTGPLVPETEVKTIFTQFRASIPQVSSERDEQLPTSVFKEIVESMPICGVLNKAGVPLHPPSVNNSQGRVNVRRQMGGSPSVPLGLRQIIQVLGSDVLERKYVYTGGTWKGFVKRLSQQMSRKTYPLHKTIAEVSGAREVGDDVVLNLLDLQLPRNKAGFPGLDEDLFDVLLNSIKTTANASAGAPYWRNKGECMQDILEVGLPMIVKAIKENKLNQLRSENPELFLCEVKNKMDRYEIAKLDDKTRPYTCVPAHWAFLFSILTQGFQEGLSLFVDEGVSSSNAYGFSSSDGGLTRMYEWMMSADKRGKVCVYGDDACIVVRRGADVYRVDPDFKQMDGSLDRQDIRVTIKWVLRHIKRESDMERIPPFWSTVCDIWLEMASNPDFVLDGTKVYRKKSPNGLMTGVPGTTLFDTVKSCLAWNAYLDHCSMNGLDPLNENLASEFMLKQGLIVKPGTFKPAKVPKLRDGVLITDHKFLGIQMLCREWKGQLVVVPHLPYEDCLEMLVTQKDNPFEKDNSYTSQSRKLFDRMRGLMITCGFSEPRIMDAIHNVVNSIPPEVVLMQLQNSRGEKPDHITLQDFSYPDSAGFPTYEFCMSLYSGTEREGWTSLFPQLQPVLDNMRTETRALKPLLKRDKKSFGVVTYEVAFETREIAIQTDPVLETTAMFGKAEVVKQDVPVRPRSKIVSDPPRKRLPSLPEVVVAHLNDYGGIITLGELARLVGAPLGVTHKACIKAGLFTTGHASGDLISIEPVQVPLPVKPDPVVPNDVVDRYTSLRTQFRKQVPTVIQTKPEMVYIDIGALDQFQRGSGLVTDSQQAFARLNEHFQKEGYEVSWKVGTVDVKHPLPVPVTLVIRLQRTQDWFEIAEARSISSKLAKGYIARMVLVHLGFDIADSPQTVRFVPPPAEFAQGSWTEEVEKTVEQIMYQQPAVVDVLEPLEKRERRAALEILREKYPGAGGAIPVLYDEVLGNPAERVFLVSRMLDRAIEQVENLSSSSSSEDLGRSVRSKYTPAKRTRLNRKNHLRRQKRLKSLQGSD